MEQEATSPEERLSRRQQAVPAPKQMGIPVTTIFDFISHSPQADVAASPAADLL
jgi:hypothetical protein